MIAVVKQQEINKLEGKRREEEGKKTMYTENQNGNLIQTGNVPAATWFSFFFSRLSVPIKRKKHSSQHDSQHFLFNKCTVLTHFSRRLFVRP